MSNDSQFKVILNDLREIRLRVSRVTDFLLEVKPDLDQMQQIKGLVQPATGVGFRVVSYTTPEPGTLTEKVLVIFREAKAPLMPKDVAKEYANKGWSKPRRGSLYAAISGTISYLLNTRKILKKEDAGYSLVNTLLDAPNGSRQQEQRA